MTERKAKWQNDYIARTYDRVNLTLPKGQKEVVQAHAAAHGESVNGFIGRAIVETMERDSGGAAAPESAPVERVLAEMPTGGPQGRGTYSHKGNMPQEAAGGLQGGGMVSLSPDTLEAAQRAAGRTGESVAAFVARAVAEQGKRDDNAFKMGINPA